jgi:hypothetical protein
MMAGSCEHGNELRFLLKAGNSLLHMLVLASAEGQHSLE